MAASDEPEVKPELIGVGQSETIETEVVRDGASPAKTLLALLVVGLIGFALFRPTGGDLEAVEENSEIAGEEPESEAAETEPTTTTAKPRATTTADPESGEDEDGEVQQGEPVFDFETGWDLIIGNNNSITRYRLDGGDIETTANRRVPIAVVGDYLVTSSLQSDSVSYVPLDNWEDDPVPIGGASPFYGAGGPNAIPHEAGAIWLLGGTFESLTWRLWELGDEPVVIRELEAPSSIFGPAPSHPEIIGATSGGVFSYSGDEISKVADGRLMSVTDSHAVVEQCESPFSCGTFWLSLDSWEPDRTIITPQVGNPYFLFLMVVSPGSKYAFVFDYENDRDPGQIWNLTTGEPEHQGFAEEGIAFSPDGRFAAGVLRQGGLAVIDLESGERVDVDLPGARGFGRIVFAPAS